MPRVDPEQLLLPRRKARIDEVVARRVSGLTVVLENVHDPHNLAAVLRTVEGLGLQEVHVVEARSGFRPNAAVTQGADKWLDVVRHREIGACVAALRHSHRRILGSRLTDDAVPVEQLPFGERLALVFGNEHAGLSADFSAQCDGFFRIPMNGFAQSFNVSVAVGMALGTAMLERRRLGLGGDLTDAQQASLRQRFYALSADLPGI
jgi:tRNA (guanosine-2'-O-)-methyltransferase